MTYMLLKIFIILILLKLQLYTSRIYSEKRVQSPSFHILTWCESRLNWSIDFLINVFREVIYYLFLNDK